MARAAAGQAERGLHIGDVGPVWCTPYPWMMSPDEADSESSAVRKEETGANRQVARR